MLTVVGRVVVAQDYIRFLALCICGSISTSVYIGQLGLTLDEEVSKSSTVGDKLRLDPFGLNCVSSLGIWMGSCGVYQRALHCSYCEQKVLHRGEHDSGTAKCPHKLWHWHDLILKSEHALLHSEEYAC